MARIPHVRMFPVNAIQKNIDFMKQGSYAVVTHGRLGDVEVAIKDYKEGFNDEVVNEITILSRLTHPNVIAILGIIHEGDSQNFIKFPKILLEFMYHGSLLDLVKEAKGSLLFKQMLKILLHITSGMSYVHDMGVIHRNLACRNILIDKYGNAKIADFGFSVQTNPNDVNKLYSFKSDEVKRIPYRWMPPEAVIGLLDNIPGFGFYSKSCDIWSFGVVIFEILSPYRSPYEMEPFCGNFIPESIFNGRTPKDYSPLAAPKFIMELMDRTFASYERRPQFSEIRGELTHYLREFENSTSFEFKKPIQPLGFLKQIKLTASCSNDSGNGGSCSTSFSSTSSSSSASSSCSYAIMDDQLSEEIKSKYPDKFGNSEESMSALSLHDGSDWENSEEMDVLYVCNPVEIYPNMNGLSYAKNLIRKYGKEGAVEIVKIKTLNQKSLAISCRSSSKEHGKELKLKQHMSDLVRSMLMDSNFQKPGVKVKAILK